MTTNLFVIANVKQLRTGGSFRILLSFFRTSWGVGFLNSAIFNSFHNHNWHDFGGPSEFRGWEGLNPPLPPLRYATGPNDILYVTYTTDFPVGGKNFRVMRMA